MTKTELDLIVDAIQAALDMAAGEGEENNEHAAICDVVYKIGERLAENDPTFSYARFIEACGAA